MQRTLPFLLSFLLALTFARAEGTTQLAAAGSELPILQVDFPLVTPAADRDGDGTADINDRDNDDDGIPDAEEDGGTGFSPTADADADGTPNYRDDTDATRGFPAFADANGDGVNDAYDADLDGVIDAFDRDADNDGITDLVESGGTDIDGDGAVDDAADEDGDGLADAYDNNDTDGPLGSGIDTSTPSTSTLSDPVATGTPVARDSDGDGVPDTRDLDADNDGIADVIEAGGTDANGDGRADAFADGNGDGLSDGGPFVSTGADTDGDGRPDSYPAAIDLDRDGKPDYADRDADGDGIADAVEAGATDADADGIADGFSDSEPDGLHDTYSGANAVDPVDTDDDGVPDYLDRDSDGDGISDVVEVAGVDADGDGVDDTTTDANGDGLADAYVGTANARAYTTADSNGDGAPDGPLQGFDADSDGLLDHLDRDADGDGLADYTEAGGSDTNKDGRVDSDADLDGDGLADRFDPYDDLTDATRPGVSALAVTNGSGTVVGPANDPDADGYPNWLDRDTDNDGLFDLYEARGAALDTDGDGRVDATADADGDGLDDAVDGDVTDGPGPGGSTPGTALATARFDTDGDGLADEGYEEGGLDPDGDDVPSFRDLDADGDGLTDVVEQGGGATAPDGAGALDGRMDADPFADWTLNTATAPLDSDTDGVPDYLDRDADNDGIADAREAVCTACPATYPAAGTDADGNGVDDRYQGLTAANATSGRNVGATPSEVGGGPAPDYLDLDTDGDGAPDYTEGFDDDGDGAASDDLIARAAAYTGAATDYPATDSDADGLPDWLDELVGLGSTEAQRPPFLDPATVYWHDVDLDGLADLVDGDAGGAATTLPNRDGANDADWRDDATLAPRPLQLLDFSTAAYDCSVEVRWRAVERQFGHYVLEGSDNGREFRDLASGDARNGGSEELYSVVVDAPRGMHYYRLRLVDGDGATTHSETVAATVRCGRREGIQAYPNPVSGVLTFRIVSPVSGSLKLLSPYGQVVARIRVEADEPADLVLRGLPAGTYTLGGEAVASVPVVVR